MLGGTTEVNADLMPLTKSRQTKGREETTRERRAKQQYTSSPLIKYPSHKQDDCCKSLANMIIGWRHQANNTNAWYLRQGEAQLHKLDRIRTIGGCLTGRFQARQLVKTILTEFFPSSLMRQVGQRGAVLLMKKTPDKQMYSTGFSLPAYGIIESVASSSNSL